MMVSSGDVNLRQNKTTCIDFKCFWLQCSYKTGFAKSVETVRESKMKFHRLKYLSRNNIVDGNWGEWSPWTKCDKPCGRGSQSRSRKCNNPAPQGGGRPCSGSSSEKRHCYNKRCCPGNNRIISFFTVTNVCKCTLMKGHRPACLDILMKSLFLVEETCM